MNEIPTSTVPRFRDGLRTCVTVFLVVRLALFAISAVGVGLMPLEPRQPTSVPGWPANPLESGLGNVFTATERQDALWFLRIASDGYRPDDPSAAFFPLYPTLVRVVAWLPGIGTLAAALLVSNAACFGSLLVLHALTRREFGDSGVADLAVRYTAIFPTAFFLMAPYTESVFLLLVLLAFWWARRDRWALVALAAALAALTRSVGVVLAPALALEALRAPRAREVAARLAASAAPALGLILYLGAWWRATGDFFRPISVQSDWRPHLTMPWSAAWHGLGQALRYGGWWAVDAVIVGGVGLALLAGVPRLRPSYLAYGILSMTLPLFAMYPSRPFLSMPRFACVLFPVSWVLASWTSRRPRLDPLVTGVLAGGWALLATSFVNWGNIF